MPVEMAEVPQVRITFQACGTKLVVEQIVASAPTTLARSMRAGSGAVGQAKHATPPPSSGPPPRGSGAPRRNESVTVAFRKHGPVRTRAERPAPRLPAAHPRPLHRLRAGVPDQIGRASCRERV